MTGRDYSRAASGTVTPSRAGLERASFAGDLAHAPSASPGTASLYWLGQAGFLIKISDLTIVIDAYLSDTLAEKYAGTELPHDRVMPAPVEPAKLDSIDFILCSHRHTDHLDPETVLAILSASPQSVLIAPRAIRARLAEIGVPEDRTILVNAGDEVALGEAASLVVTASAHEGLEIDENGDHPFVGYAIRSGDLVIFHSGDCVPFEGLTAAVARLGVDLALLPVNGRRPELSRRGVPGNFFPQEAAELCDAAGIPNLIFHHFGMFSFNSADPREALDEIVASCPRITAFPAELAMEFRIVPNTQDWSPA